MKSLLRALFVVAPFVLAPTSFAQAEPAELNRPLKVLYQPKAVYTDRARAKDVEGEVFLRITFLASGEIGEIQNVTKKNGKRLLKYGLVDQAIAAVRKIQFTPKVVNGVPVDVVKTYSYSFTTY
ncbi:MAG TPA: TonB family protein [Pyrinomonadaceae bacterium]|nr:TonB family protein [Pyrinomonadaceae bacterium]